MGESLGWGTRLLRVVMESTLMRRAVALLARSLPTPTVELVPYDVTVPGLPGRLDGLRILHVSDLHLHTGGALVEQIPALIAHVDYDLMVYTGDFIDTDEDLPRLESVLSRLPHRAPSFAVLGNHDHLPFGKVGRSNNVARLTAMLSSAGITVLSNAAQPLFEGTLVIAGVDDPATQRDDLGKALDSVDDGVCYLLLAHSPDIVLRPGHYRPGLVLAGHTHGGQIRLPWLGAVLTMSKIPRRLAMGLHMYEDVPLFVTRGIGYSGFDIRLNCSPEVALLTLRSPADSPAYVGAEPVNFEEARARMDAWRA